MKGSGHIQPTFPLFSTLYTWTCFTINTSNHILTHFKKKILRHTSSSFPLITRAPAVLMQDLLKYQEDLPTKLTTDMAFPLIAFLL